MDNLPYAQYGYGISGTPFWQLAQQSQPAQEALAASSSSSNNEEMEAAVEEAQPVLNNSVNTGDVGKFEGLGHLLAESNARHDWEQQQQQQQDEQEQQEQSEEFGDLVSYDAYAADGGEAEGGMGGSAGAGASAPAPPAPAATTTTIMTTAPAAVSNELPLRLAQPEQPAQPAQTAQPTAQGSHAFGQLPTPLERHNNPMPMPARNVANIPPSSSTNARETRNLRIGSTASLAINLDIDSQHNDDDSSDSAPSSSTSPTTPESTQQQQHQQNNANKKRKHPTSGDHHPTPGTNKRRSPQEADRYPTSHSHLHSPARNRRLTSSARSTSTPRQKFTALLKRLLAAQQGPPYKSWYHHLSGAMRRGQAGPAYAPTQTSWGLERQRAIRRVEVERFQRAREGRMARDRGSSGSAPGMRGRPQHGGQRGGFGSAPGGARFQGRGFTDVFQRWEDDEVSSPGLRQPHESGRERGNTLRPLDNPWNGPSTAPPHQQNHQGQQCSPYLAPGALPLPHQSLPGDFQQAYNPLRQPGMTPRPAPQSMQKTYNNQGANSQGGVFTQNNAPVFQQARMQSPFQGANVQQSFQGPMVVVTQTVHHHSPHMVPIEQGFRPYWEPAQHHHSPQSPYQSQNQAPSHTPQMPARQTYPPPNPPSAFVGPAPQLNYDQAAPGLPVQLGYQHHNQQTMPQGQPTYLDPFRNHQRASYPQNPLNQSSRSPVPQNHAFQGAQYQPQQQMHLPATSSHPSNSPTHPSHPPNDTAPYDPANQGTQGDPFDSSFAKLMNGERDFNFD